MAKFIENLGKNIPPKARLVIAITIALTGASAVYMIDSLASGGNDEQDIAGKADIIGPPKKEDIDKSKPGEVSIIPEESPAGQAIEAEREREIEKAKKSGGGFMDKIEISNSRAVIDELNERDSGGLIDQDIGGDIDDSLDQRDEIRFQRKKLAQAKRDRANKVLQEKEMQEQIRSYQNQVKDEESFINNEISKYQNNPYLEAIGNEDLYAVNGSSSGYQSFTEGDSEAFSGSSRVGTTSSGKGKSRAEKMVDRYTRNNPSTGANLSALDRARGLANERTGGNGTPNGGSLSSNSIDVESNQSNYNSIVNPVGSAKVETTEHVSVGEMHYAILQIGVNTDEIGPVRAIIPGNGKLGEAVLIGTPVRVGEKASIAFNNMSVDGKDYSISAIALDSETMRPGLADDVDRHVFERYFKLALAAAADGYVDAISNYTTTTTSSGSSETIYEAMPDASDQFAAAIGKVGEVLVPKFQDDFDRDPTITVDQNKDILVMFMSGVDIPK